MTQPDMPIEDILASIRRAMDADRPADAAPAPSHDEADELELTTPVADTPGPVLPPSAPRPMVSDAAAAASRHALAHLAALKMGAEGTDDTLAGLVRELLKPMLKAWLDEHLPATVERMVVQEIARLSALRA